MLSIEQEKNMVDARLLNERPEEIIRRDTMLVDGHWFTTVVFRSEPIVPTENMDGMQETRYHIFVDGKGQSGGGIHTEWLPNTDLQEEK